MADETDLDEKWKRRKRLSEELGSQPLALTPLGVESKLPRFEPVSSVLGVGRSIEIKPLNIPSVLATNYNSTAIRILEEKVKEYECRIAELDAKIVDKDRMIADLLSKKNIDHFQ
jgi:hypothetical protein